MKKLLFIGAYDDFMYKYERGEFRDYFKTAKQVFLTEKLKRNFTSWKMFIQLTKF